MREQRLLNTLWIVVPALMAVVISGRGGRVEVVAKNLPRPPVALATDQHPASADGFSSYLDSTVHTPAGHSGYLAGLGVERLLALRNVELPA